jgi:hypothetical protein
MLVGTADRSHQREAAEFAPPEGSPGIAERSGTGGPPLLLAPTAEVSGVRKEAPLGVSPQEAKVQARCSDAAVREQMVRSQPRRATVSCAASSSSSASAWRTSSTSGPGRRAAKKASSAREYQS